MRHSSCVLIAFAVFVLTGCGSSKPLPAVELQAYDALTNEPIAGVTVTRWEMIYGANCVPTLIAKTGHDGLIGSALTAWAPSFIFTKDGYQPAEVRVGGGESYIASPSAGNRWINHGAFFFPPKDPVFFEEDRVPSWPLIRVPMWPSPLAANTQHMTMEQWKKQFENASPVMGLK